MRRVYLFCITVICLSACVKEIDYLDSISGFDNANIAQVDTFTVQATITRPDSIQTSGWQSFKFGKVLDPDFGTTVCKMVTAVSLPVNSINLDGNYFFDSLVLTIKPDGSFQGDTTKAFNVVVKRLSQNLSNENNVFFGHHRFETLTQSLGSTNLTFRPSVDDSIDVRLSDDLGRTLFDYFKTNNNIIRDNAVFQDWFKGIEVSMETTGEGLLFEIPNSEEGIRLRLFYHQDLGRKEQYTHDFLLSNVNAYTSMEFDRTGTATAILDNQISMPANISNPLLYHHSVSDIRTEFTFPGIQELLKQATYFSLIEAKLTVKLQNLPGSFSVYPAQLNLYYKDISGAESGPVSDVDGQALDGDLYYDAAYPHQSYYSFDVSDYVRNELTSDSYNKLRLVLRNGDPSTAISQLVAGLPGNKQYQTKLVVTYLTYNP